MFTGLIQGQGTVQAVTPLPDTAGARLQVGAPWLDGTLGVDDSVAVSGCCVTVTARTPEGFAADLVAETLQRTTLGALGEGARVNLELPLRVGDRLDGHLVQGHVDGVGQILDVHAVGDGREVRVGLDPDLARYVAEKGSVAVDGVSLTVTAAGADHFAVALIPHTLAVTTLGDRGPGDRVNLEVDVLAKYVERLLAAPGRQEPR